MNKVKKTMDVVKIIMFIVTFATVYYNFRNIVLIYFWTIKIALQSLQQYSLRAVKYFYCFSPCFSCFLPLYLSFFGRPKNRHIAININLRCITDNFTISCRYHGCASLIVVRIR